MQGRDRPVLTHGEKKRRRLHREHRDDPRCRVCLTFTVIFLTEKKLPDNAAVLAREWPRSHPMGQQPGVPARRYLMCASCAGERAANFESARPIEELWAASGRVGAVFNVAEG